jgi:pimeloyl-ACP methyl ester carboxylesterase
VTHVLLLVVVGLVLTYVGWLLMLWRFQERIVFQPPANIASSRTAARQVTYRASDGVELFAFVVGDCGRDTTVLLAFHGNADISRWFLPWASEAARQASVCVVLPEYRGYDGLAGTPTYAGSAHDAFAAYAYVRDTMGVAPSNIVMFGHSLGTAIAAELAAAHRPRAMVLQSPFSSARDMASRMVVPGITALWGVISRVHFDTIERVRGLACPVWVTHGERDVIIPVRMGCDVFTAAANKGELLIVEGAGHNDVPEVGGTRYWTWLRRAVHETQAVVAVTDAPAGTRSAP